MKQFHPPIRKFLQHYAESLNDSIVLSILETNSIDTELIAIALLEFLDKLCEEVAKDAKLKRVILQQPVHVEDAITVCQTVQEHLDTIGYGHLVD